MEKNPNEINLEFLRLKSRFVKMRKLLIITYIALLLLSVITIFLTFSYQETAQIVVKIGDEKIPIEDAYIDLIKENNSLKRKSMLDEAIFKSIKKRYAIDVEKTDSFITYHAPQLDSALMILPLYRDKIEHVEDTDEWIVTRENDSVVVKRHFFIE